MHPLQLIILGIANFFTLGLIALDIFLFREWYNHKDIVYDHQYANRCLIFAIVVIIIVSLGKYIFGWLIGKKGNDEPNMERSNESLDIDRPEGHTLHVEFYGLPEAQPIIMLHGWSSNSTQWFYFKKSLSTNYRLILVDLPGLGNSGKPKNKDYSLDKFARDLSSVIEMCGDKKPIILGHSIGGMTILTACKLFGKQLYDKISGIVLVHTTYTNPVKTAIFSRFLTAIYKPILTPILHVMIALAPFYQLMNWLKFLNGSMHISNHLSGFAGTETRGQLTLTAYLSTIPPVDVVSRGSLAMFEYDATPILSSINTPVLVITGDKDILTKKEAGQYIASKISGSKLTMLSPCAHMGVLERNAEMIAAIRSFEQETHLAPFIKESL